MTRAELARTVGHSAQWLSMLLHGKRGIRLEDIDRIARVLEVTTAGLFEDPDLDPGLSQPYGTRPEVARHAKSSTRSSASTEARLREQSEIIARQHFTIEQQQRTLEEMLSYLRPIVASLERLVAVTPATREDSRGPETRSTERSRPARTGGGRRR